MLTLGLSDSEGGRKRLTDAEVRLEVEDLVDSLDCRIADTAVAGIVDMVAAGHILVRLVEVGDTGPGCSLAANVDTEDLDADTS